MQTMLMIILGLILGSFVNALVWRLRAQEEPTKAQKKLKATELSMVTGRSMCSQCHHPLAAKDLVPVVSWLSLGGKCRYCSKPIQDTPLPELGLAALFVLSYMLWPTPQQGTTLLMFIFWLIFLTGFMALAIYDIRWQLLPDKIVWPLVGLAAVQWGVLFVTERGGWSQALNTAGALLVASGLFWLIYQVSKGEWIGGGDVKLGLILGLLAGTPLKAMLMLFIASLIGTLAAVPVMLKQKTGKGIKLPFGPFLLAGCILVVLLGDKLISAYLTTFGLS